MQVALLFLVRTRMNVEPVWEHWFSSVEGLIPRSALPVNSSLLPQMKEVCAFKPDDNVIDKQHLFSVYVHNSEEGSGM